jgi:predicted nucleotidyltransferase
MDFAKVFKFIIENFRKERIDFAIIGGFALQFSGITRATRDIDLLVLSQDSPKIKEILVSYGYKVIHESEDVLNFTSERPELGRIDFLLAHRKYSTQMLKRAQEKEIFGGKVRIKVVIIEDQIGLKVQSSSNDPSRLAQDMTDVELLIKNNYSNLDLELLKEYFDLFDRGQEFDRIIERLKNVK